MKQSQEDIELEDKMYRFGHTSFRARCFHIETEEKPNPESYITKKVCKNCGEEL